MALRASSLETLLTTVAPAVMLTLQLLATDHLPVGCIRKLHTWSSLIHQTAAGTDGFRPTVMESPGPYRAQPSFRSMQHRAAGAGLPRNVGADGSEPDRHRRGAAVRMAEGALAEIAGASERRQHVAGRLGARVGCL